MDTVQPRQTASCSLHSGWEQVQTRLVHDDYTVVTKQHLDTHNTNAYHVHTLKLYNFLSFFHLPLQTKAFSRNMDLTNSWMESIRAWGGGVTRNTDHKITLLNLTSTTKWEYSETEKRMYLFHCRKKITCCLLHFGLPCLRTDNRRNFLNPPHKVHLMLSSASGFGVWVDIKTMSM